MNKNEFYKQLMSEYSFDADKIRENAKRGKNARQKLQPMYIGMSAAVAAMVVTAGSIAAVNLTKNDGVSLTDSGNATLSPSDRVIHALEQLELERGSEESKDFYVTFSVPMSPAEAQNVLAGTEVRQLYFADGTRVSDAGGIAGVFSGGGEADITGAAVYCTGDMAATLQSSPSVFLIEAMSESDIQNAVPVNISEVDTAEVTLPDSILPTDPVTKPDSTTAALPTQEGTAEAADTGEMDGTAEPEAPTEEMDGTAEPEATTEAVTDETVTTEPENPVPPAETTPSTTPGTTVTDVPTEEPGQPATLPEGVTLPTAPASAGVNTYVLADSAFFMTNDIFYVKTDSSVAIYRYSDGEASLLASAEIGDPKIVWASENSSRLIVSGTSDYGTRGRMLYINAGSESITDLHTDDMIMGASLQSASYNADSKLLVVNIREEGRYYLIAAQVDGSSAEYVDTFAESDRKLTVAAAHGSTVYYTENSGGTSVLRAYNVQTGSSSTVRTFDSVVSVSRNLAFTHVVFTSDETGAVSIFDPETEKLIQVSGSDNVNFGASKHSFVSGGSVYTIAGGTAVNSGGLSVTAAIDYRRSGSEKYSATISGGCVKVSESIYSSTNKNSLMTFSEITENASSDIRAALDGAIGVNNALALGAVEESGITKPQTLVDCIKLYYSGSASDKLMTRCGISGLGALHYENGGLAALNVNDAVLVIGSEGSSSASGTLYVRAGSFAGRTAFRSMNVSFVKENGVWKLDGVL